MRKKGIVRQYRHYRLLLMDLRNGILSWQFLLSVALGAATCFFTLLFCGNYQSETIHKYVLLHDRAQSFLAYIVGILPYAMCFYGDLAFNNIRNIVGRIPLRDYVRSKTVIAYLSTILAFTCGKLLFVGLHSLYNPVCVPDSFDRLPSSLLYFDMAREGSYFSYFLFSSLQKSFYCGILCQVVMLFSIWMKNISVVFSIPIAVFYVFHFYVNSKIQIEQLNFSKIYDGTTRVWTSDWANFLYAFLLMLFCGGVLYCITLVAFERKVYHG